MAMLDVVAKKEWEKIPLPADLEYGLLQVKRGTLHVADIDEEPTEETPFLAVSNFLNICSGSVLWARYSGAEPPLVVIAYR